MPRRLPHALLALALLAATLHATVVVALDLPELVAGARLVVEGRVVSAEASRAPSGLVTTRVELETVEVFKDARTGALPADEGRVAFELPGGEADGVGLVVPGMPTLEPGERVVLLLSARSARGFRLPVGLGQGVLHLEPDADGVLRVRRELDGVALVGTDGRPVEAVPSVPADRDALAARLRALVAAETDR